jgi:hypothetical protein
MKKLIYTLGLVAFLGFAGMAQTAEPAKKQTVKDDGTTIAPASAKTDGDHAPQNKQAQPSTSQKTGDVDKTPAKTEQPTDKPAKRMAITEKGVPASKNKDVKPAESKETKSTDQTKKEHH